MFRASDVFGRRPGSALDTVPDDQAAAKRKAGTINRVWNPATGGWEEEDIPSDIQALMGKQPKAAKVEHRSQNAWQPKVLGPAAVGLSAKGRAPAAQQRGLGPAGDIDRTAPSVEYRGFSKVDLNDRYFERPKVTMNGRHTYWSSDAQFFIYWQGEVQRWSICDAASWPAVKAGQLPGWAYKEDHRHLCQANGWMEAWNGEWCNPDLEVVFRSGTKNKPQWEDIVAQRMVQCVEFHGFAMRELNTRYFLKPGKIIQGKPSFWDASGVYFVYWQQATGRWALCDLKCLPAVESGKCPGWAYRADGSFLANACGWVESRNGEWGEADLEVSVISTCVRGLKVALHGFHKQELNTQFSERPDEEIQGKPSYWDPAGDFFLYWQSSMKRWAICDKMSLTLAQNGLAPGWAYRTDSLHFTKGNKWSEVWGKSWTEAKVVCTLLEGVVKERHEGVKAEVTEDASGTQFSSKQYKALVKIVYQKKNPTKLQNLKSILEKWAGREHELFSTVCSKYGCDPDDVAAELPCPGAEIPQEEAPADGEDAYAHLEDAQVPELKASEFAVLVQAAYEIYNPSKIADMGRLLKKFKSRERELYLEVCKKYGAHPAKFHARQSDEAAAEGQMALPA